MGHCVIISKSELFDFQINKLEKELGAKVEYLLKMPDPYSINSFDYFYFSNKDVKDKRFIKDYRLKFLGDI